MSPQSQKKYLIGLCEVLANGNAMCKIFLEYLQKTTSLNQEIGEILYQTIIEMIELGKEELSIKKQIQDRQVTKFKDQMRKSEQDEHKKGEQDLAELLKKLEELKD